MRIAPVLFDADTGGRRVARWRPMTGMDELALFGADYPAAVEWMAGMMAGGDDGAVTGTHLFDLTVGQGDRLFEAVYRAFFGVEAEMRQTCSGCGEGYELTIALDDLALARRSDPPGTIVLPGGTALRAWHLRDLLAVRAGASLADLLERAIEHRGSDDALAIETGVEALMPCAIETIETACPDCAATQIFLFDLSRFLLDCLARERPVLLREVHLLAQTYGWSFSEIMALDRATRHGFVRLATASLPARRRVRSA